MPRSEDTSPGATTDPTSQVSQAQAAQAAEAVAKLPAPVEPPEQAAAEEQQPETRTLVLQSNKVDNFQYHYVEDETDPEDGSTYPVERSLLITTSGTEVDPDLAGKVMAAALSSGLVVTVKG